MSSSLRFDQLAFSSPPPPDINETQQRGEYDGLVKADARTEFQPSSGGPLLNIELFGSGWIAERKETLATPETADNVLLFVPGVCESAETWTAQHIAQLCQENAWRLAILELPGHGLSGGPRAVFETSGRNGLESLVNVVVEAASHVIQLKTKTSSSETKLVLSGSSLGGALAAYASPRIAKMLQDKSSSEAQIRFVGNLLLSPAVGVAKTAVPPSMIVSALSCLAYMAPAAAIMTPTEDPSHYSCPPWSKRNYSGQWPLGTSKLLLDITSTIVPEDVKETQKSSAGRNPLSCAAGTATQSFVLTGVKDPVVPIDSVRTFVKAISSEESPAVLVEIPKGDHGLLASSKGKVVDLTREKFQDGLLTLASL